MSDDHLHYHADEAWIRPDSGRGAVALALVVGLNPCILLLPIVLAAASRGRTALAVVVLAYAVVTTTLMVGLSVLGVAGSRRIPVPGAARHIEMGSGLLIAAVGVAFLVFGG